MTQNADKSTERTEILTSAEIPGKARRPRRMAREPSVVSEPAAGAPAPQKEPAPRGESKIASVIAMLKREGGATLDELVNTTGCLPHTTRAALTGLRKKGHTIAKTKRGEATCYRIEEAA